MTFHCKPYQCKMTADDPKEFCRKRREVAIRNMPPADLPDYLRMRYSNTKAIDFKHCITCGRGIAQPPRF